MGANSKVVSIRIETSRHQEYPEIEFARKDVTSRFRHTTQSYELKTHDSANRLYGILNHELIDLVELDVSQHGYVIVEVDVSALQDTAL